MRVEAHFATDVGRRREHNEDYVACHPDLGLFVVCDGMGGHAAGEVASRLTCETVVDLLRADIDQLRAWMCGERSERRAANDRISAAVRAANARVREAGERDPSQRGMGTTLTLLLLNGERAIVAQVGDSRLYLRRGGNVHQVTTDHTIRTELVRAGRPLNSIDAKHLDALTRAVGVHPSLEVDIVELDVLPGDIFILCSDGLHSYFNDFDLAGFLEHSRPRSVAGDLVEHANKRGGHDNISLISLHILGGEETETTLRVRLTLDTLKTIPLFHYLSFAELLKVIPTCQTRIVSAGDELVVENDASSDFYIIVEGEVRVHRGGAEIARLGPGRYFGEMSLVDNRPRSASVTAATSGHLIRISRDAFYEMLRADSVMAVKLLWNFIQTLSGMVRVQNEARSSAPVEHPYGAPHSDES